MAYTSSLQQSKTSLKSRQNNLNAKSTAMQKVTSVGGGAVKTNVRTVTETKTVGGVTRTITRTFTTEVVEPKKTTTTTTTTKRVRKTAA